MHIIKLGGNPIFFKDFPFVVNCSKLLPPPLQKMPPSAKNTKYYRSGVSIILSEDFL